MWNKLLIETATWIRYVSFGLSSDLLLAFLSLSIYSFEVCMELEQIANDTEKMCLLFFKWQAAVRVPFGLKVMAVPSVFLDWSVFSAA